MTKKRVVIKVSGEVFMAKGAEANLDFPTIKKFGEALKKLVSAGYEVAIVPGGGNIFRARMVEGEAIDRVVADQMGMLGTSLNALALQSTLQKMDQPAVVMSAFVIPEVMEIFQKQKALEHLANKRVVIFACGAGRPYFTTDTTLVLRALEIGTKDIYKATNVEGVYDSDPDANTQAKLYKELSYAEALDKKLRVMDATAFALARENNLNLTVFKFSPENIVAAVTKGQLGTKVSNESR
jgi:uridylate kinase